MGMFSAFFALSIFLLTSWSKKPAQDATAQSVTYNSTVQSPAEDDLLLYLPFDGRMTDESAYQNPVRGFGILRYVAEAKEGDGMALELRAEQAARLEVEGSVLENLNEYTILIRFLPYDQRPMVLLSRTQFAECSNMHQGFSLMTGFRGDGTRFLSKKGGECDNIYTSTAFGTPVTSSEAPRVNEWNALAITFDKLHMQTWLNGARVASGKEPGGNLCYGAPLQIGSWWQGEPYYFNGLIDEIRIYKRVLSEAEIATALLPQPPKQSCAPGTSY